MRTLALSVLLGFTVLVVTAVVAGAPAQRTRAPTYYEQVKPILDGRCVGCHVTGGIAPFPLRTYSDARRRRAAVAAAVRTRAMPPWHAERGHRRYLADPSLTDRQIATIVRWAKAGAPRGNPARAGRPLPPVGGGLSREDVRLELPEYIPQRNAAGHDDYRCFVVNWPPGRTHVTGFDVTPGERRQVHHAIVYVAPPAYAATVDEWDAREPGPGYGCYGGPSATGARQIPAWLLAGWAPGSAGADLPAGTGILVEPGSRLVVQTHYNVEGRTPRPDRSTVAFKTDDTVARRGAYAPVVDLRWLVSPRSFRISAGAKRVRHAFAGDPRAALSLLGQDLDLRGGFVVHSALLHMHRLGERGQVALVRGRRSSVLLSIRRWDFDWQRDYRLATPVRFRDGDRLSVRCEHDNTRAKQPLRNGRRPAPRTVYWGEDSADEMCIAFLYVSEP